jgi:glycosyltransferase involved in cell wall biosynthesis
MSSLLNFSVLISVYHKENPLFFNDSLNSIINQTLIPDEIVLVQDGPITAELESVIKYFKNKFVNLKVIVLESNKGLGFALNTGILNCMNNIVIRMDSDDISTKDRFEKLIDHYKKNTHLSVIGSFVDEFETSPLNILRTKRVPLEHSEIIKLSRYRNPINHPTVLMIKEHVILSGNYLSFHLNEDYYLWVRMIKHGYLFANLPDSYVKMRVSNSTYIRRRGYKYFLAQQKLFEYILKEGLINPLEYILGSFIRFFFKVIAPIFLVKFLYNKILRSKKNEK